MVVDATYGTVQQPTGDPGRVHTGEMALAWAVVEVPAPIRALTVGVTEVGLALLAFGDRPDLAERAASRLGEPLVSDPALTGVATRQLTEYLAGDRQVFDLPLDWRLSAGSGLRVLQALYATVPYGETVTYGELAARSGLGTSYTAARGVGSIMGANPIAVVVPCHRVLAADGLGGFGGGRPAKEQLLALEGALTAPLF
jgi:methylated-DNA-[protein]-cysteine S-methyltransferase